MRDFFYVVGVKLICVIKKTKKYFSIKFFSITFGHLIEYKYMLIG